MKATAASGKGQYYTDVHAGDTHLRVLVTGLGANGALAVALPLTDVDNALSSQLLLLAVIAAGGIALAALLGTLVARTALSPIARFTRQTESIAANTDWLERQRLDVVGDDELARLARTFNTTLDALEGSVKAQRNLVADASHELRTPIASIRANLQLMRDEALLSPADREALRTDMIEELDDLTALVSDVVELARGTKPDGDRGDVRVDEIAVDAVERARRRAPGITIRVKLEPTLVRGEGDRVARAIANLLDNAVKWSPTGGVVEVELHDGTLTVRDHGPGFHEDDLPVRIRSFPPCEGRPLEAGVRAGAGDRAPGRRGARWLGRGTQRPGGRRAAEHQLRGAARARTAAARADQRALTRLGRGARQLSWLRPEPLTVTVIVRARGQEATSSTGAPRFETIAPPVARTP